MSGFDPVAAELQGQVNELKSELAKAEGSERWAIRSLAKVAQALEEALGEDWAENGEGNLAAGVTLLARQLEMAERGGAVRVLRKFAAICEADDAPSGVLNRNGVIRDARSLADRIERGEVEA
jgi:hypothetical protein